VSTPPRLSPLAYSLFVAALAGACADRTDTSGDAAITPSSTSAGGGVGGSSAPAVNGGSGGGIVLNVSGSASGGTGAGGEGDKGKVIMSLPSGFTESELGGYQLGPAVDGAAGSDGAGASAGGSSGLNGNCGNVLLGVVRDFKGADEPNGHPDFEADIAGRDATPGLVAQTLGADRKPVYASQCELGAADITLCPYSGQTTSSANFAQWYGNVPGVNQSHLISIFLEPQPDGLFSFESLHYFPIDGAGFMSQGLEYTGELHNFGFTTEIHTQFRYRGGEKFTFQGDDDVWVFINDKLAVDLGGLHSMQRRSIDLDQQAGMLGLSLGTTYPLDLFHAERHTDASTFRIDTNLTFVDCGTVVPEPVK
jgi:fibro-slime domain-containing protein